jgi:hypothetical protein
MNPGFCDYKVVISCGFGSRTSIADEIAEHTPGRKEAQTELQSKLRIMPIQKTARPMASRREHIKFPRAQMGEMSENLFSGCSAPSCGLSNCDTTKIRTQDEKKYTAKSLGGIALSLRPPSRCLP